VKYAGWQQGKSGMADIRLVATDLDGTLIGSASELPVYEVFRDKLNELRSTNGTVWAACTGRPFRSFHTFFTPMSMIGLMPDFLVIRHAYVYSLTKTGYVPHVFWNLHILYLVWINRLYVREAIKTWHETITGSTVGVRTLRRNRERLRLAFDSEEAAQTAAAFLEKNARPYRQLRVFKYVKEVDVMSIPYTKGLAVSELAKHLNIKPEHILAIGNGHNDISMLEPKVAEMSGCPVNSEPEVMEVVHQSGGHIANGRSLTGVMEILQAHLDGKVCSDLPEWWEHPSLGFNPRPRRSSSRKRKRRKQVVTAWLFLAVTYVALLSLASLNAIPFSDVIMKPISLLMSLAEKLVSSILG